MNTIIEKIRAEVERRKKEMVDASFPPVIKKTRISEFSIVLDILDDIQERTDNPITFTLQEKPVKIDIRKELESIEFMGVNDARDSETIARHFYELGRQSKPKVSEGLEKEMEKFIETFGWGKTKHLAEKELISATARHFAQWQKEQTEKRWLEDRDGCFWDGVEEGKKAMREQMMKEAVEGIVTTRSMAGNIVTAHLDHTYKDGQKVKLIIVKEEGK